MKVHNIAACKCSLETYRRRLLLSASALTETPHPSETPLLTLLATFANRSFRPAHFGPVHITRVHGQRYSTCIFHFRSGSLRRFLTTEKAGLAGLSNCLPGDLAQILLMGQDCVRVSFTLHAVRAMELAAILSIGAAECLASQNELKHEQIDKIIYLKCQLFFL